MDLATITNTNTVSSSSITIEQSQPDFGQIASGVVNTIAKTAAASTTVRDSSIRCLENSSFDITLGSDHLNELIKDKFNDATVIVSVVILVLINFVVIAGNVLVIVAVFATPKLRTVTNFFIVSLAVADFLVGIAVLPYSLTLEILDTWIFGEIWCQGWLVTDVWLCTASILNLCAISVDRYLAVTRPVQYRSMMTAKRAKYIITAVWIVSFIICFPMLIVRNIQQKEAARNELGLRLHPLSSSSNPHQQQQQQHNLASSLPSPSSLRSLPVSVPLNFTTWNSVNSHSNSQGPVPVSSLSGGRFLTPNKIQLDLDSTTTKTKTKTKTSTLSLLLHARLGVASASSRSHTSPSSLPSSLSSPSSPSSSRAAAIVANPGSFYSSHQISPLTVIVLQSHQNQTKHQSSSGTRNPLTDVVSDYSVPAVNAGIENVASIAASRSDPSANSSGVNVDSSTSNSGPSSFFTSDECLPRPVQCDIFTDKTYVIYSALGSFFIPMFVMIFFYWRIYLVAIRTTHALKCGYRTTKAGSGGAGSEAGNEERLTLRIHRGNDNELQKSASYRGKATSDLHGTLLSVGDTRPSFGRASLMIRKSDSSMHNRSKACTSVSCSQTQYPSTTISTTTTTVPITILRTTSTRECRSTTLHSPTSGNVSSHLILSRNFEPNESSTNLNSLTVNQHHMTKPNPLIASKSSNTLSPNDICVESNGKHRRNSPGCQSLLSLPSTNSPSTSRENSAKSNKATAARLSKRTSKYQAKRLHAETKAAKTVGIIVGGFIVCWLPFFTVYLLRAFCENCIPELLFSIFFWLGYCNSMINPCIYGLFSRDFRRAFKNIVCRCRLREETSVSSLIRQIHMPTFFEDMPEEACDKHPESQEY